MAFDNKEELTALLTGATLQSITVYNVNDDYFVYNDGRSLTVDGGVELNFGTFTLSLGWNMELELFDTTLRPFPEIIGDVAHYDVDTAAFSGLTGQTITAVKDRWNWYQDLDEHFEPVEKLNYIAEELVITFESGDTLQLATINYSMGNGQINEPYYHFQGHVLVSFNNVIAIAEPA